MTQEGQKTTRPKRATDATEEPESAQAAPESAQAATPSQDTQGATPAEPVWRDIRALLREQPEFGAVYKRVNNKAGVVERATILSVAVRTNGGEWTAMVVTPYGGVQPISPPDTREALVTPDMWVPDSWVPIYNGGAWAPPQE